MPDAPVHDRYEDAATAKLWALLPEVYRAEDSAALDAPGPLRELVQRLAVQIAVVRRSIDRMWEDQSIESCDESLIPYVAAIVDTNLVAAMDRRGQRLDVANTINYRRRKGTLGLIEQLAADVTGWECRAVEFFRALARRRHGLDAPIGWPPDTGDPAGARALQRAGRLVGPLTATPAGGRIDLRHAAGASSTDTAFDEAHHRLDVRRGHGALGWYGIPKLGVFVWRSVSIAVDRATPVRVNGCDGHYAFDPTGRQIALWQARTRPIDRGGVSWRPLEEWQAPAPMTQATYDAVRSATVVPPPAGAWPNPNASFWPGSVAVFPNDAGAPLAQEQVSVWPEVGRFKVARATDSIKVSYHHGLFGPRGAGPFDRRRLGEVPAVDPLPVNPVTGDTDAAFSAAFMAALSGVTPTGTVVVGDGRTNTTVADIGSAASPISDVVVRAADERRAVVRVAAGAQAWAFQGPTTPSGARLRLEGVLFSGGDLVLRGEFDEVVVSCCTFDPGTRGDLRVPPATWDVAVDGRALAATTLWIEGNVRTLVVDRSIIGPVRTRTGGVVETLCVNDSIVQGLPVTDEPGFGAADVFDADGLFRLLRAQHDFFTQWLAAQLGRAATSVVASHVAHTAVAEADLASVVADLATLCAGSTIWDAKRFAGRPVSTDAIAAAELPGLSGDELVRSNRRLLVEAMPHELSVAAIATDKGVAQLVRTTVLGRGYVHRLESSESILDDVFLVDDQQHGCVRFTAWAAGSEIPRKYESIEVAPRAPLFVTRRFGEWGYAQVTDGADAAIRSSSTAGVPSIRSGSHDGTEMGAFCLEAASVKERSFLIKCNEFLPVGLTPVLVPMPRFDAEAETMRGQPWPPT